MYRRRQHLAWTPLPPEQIAGGGFLLTDGGFMSSGSGFGFGLGVTVAPDEVSLLPGRCLWGGRLRREVVFNDPHRPLIAIALSHSPRFLSLWGGGSFEFQPDLPSINCGDQRRPGT